MEDRELISNKTEDPYNAVEFKDATLAWEKTRGSPGKKSRVQQKRGGMKRVLRREKLSLYITAEDSKEKSEEPNAEHLLTHMEQESPQSTISSTRSIRPPLHKTLHRIDLCVRKVPRYIITQHSVNRSRYIQGSSLACSFIYLQNCS